MIINFIVTSTANDCSQSSKLLLHLWVFKGIPCRVFFKLIACELFIARVKHFFVSFKRVNIVF